MHAETKEPVIVNMAIELLIGALLLSAAFRLVSVPLLFLYVALRLFWRLRHSSRLVLSIAMLFVVSSRSTSLSGVLAIGGLELLITGFTSYL
jgi:hypothetical protein